MAETVEQLKQRAESLHLSRNSTNDKINAVNETAWQLRFVDSDLSKKLSLESLQISEQNCYERGRAYALRNIGLGHLAVDQNKEAQQVLEQSREIFLYLHDDAGLASVINSIGTSEQKFGNHPASLKSYSAALDLFGKIGDKAGIVKALGNLGSTHFRQGRYLEGIDYYYQALPLAIEHSALLSQGHIYNNLGDILWRLGETDLAFDYLEQAVNLFHAHHDQLHKGVALNNIGDALLAQREYLKTADYYEQSLAISYNVGNLELRADALRGIGSINYQMGDIKKAENNLSRAMRLAKNIGRPLIESEILLNLALVHQKLGDIPASLGMLNRALDLSEKIGSNQVKYKVHHALSEIYEKQNKMEAALEHYRAFHHFWQDIFGMEASLNLQRRLIQQKHLGLQRNLQLPHQPRQNRFTSREKQAGLSEHKLSKVTEFIKQHLEQPISLNQIADVVLLSRGQFQKSFKRSTGKTPHRFLIEQRVERAKQLLQTTSLPISEVALQCGFSSQSHLSAHFRLLTGRPPKQFRRSH